MRAYSQKLPRNLRTPGVWNGRRGYRDGKRERGAGINGRVDCPENGMGVGVYVEPALGDAGRAWGKDTSIHLVIGTGGLQGTRTQTSRKK